MGRLPALTRPKIDRIAELVAAGNTAETSALAAGVSKSAYYKYAKIGREEIQRIDEGKQRKPQKRNELYVELVEAVEKAKAEALARMMIHIVQAAPTSWQAAAWWAERNYPHLYGRSSREAAVASDTAGAVIEAVTKYAQGDHGLPSRTV